MAAETPAPMVPGDGVLYAGRFLCHDVLSPAQVERLEALGPFYTDEILERILVPFISGDDACPVSKRTIKWLVGNHAKADNTVYYYPVLGTPGLTTVKVYEMYDMESNKWGRNLFSPFRRGIKVYFTHGGVKYATTPAQLHFVYWAYVYGVLDYAISFADEIRATQKAVKEEVAARKRAAAARGIKLKRKQLTRASPSSCRIYEGTRTLNFSGRGEIPKVSRVVDSMRAARASDPFDVETASPRVKSAGAPPRRADSGDTGDTME
jgi:hypothetical protein